MRVFISYKSQDVEFARELHQHLLDWGYETWLDVVDIPVGTTPNGKGWNDAIYAGMKACQVVVGVMTPLSLQSENVKDEWVWALENKRRLFILTLENVTSEAIQPIFIRIQRIDFRTKS